MREEARRRPVWRRAMADGPAAKAPLDGRLLAGTDHPLAASVVLRSMTSSDPADRSAGGPRPAAPRSSSSPPL